MRYFATVAGHRFELEVREHQGTLSVRVDGRPFMVDALCVDGRAIYSLLVEGRSYEVIAERSGERAYVTVGGETFEVHLADALTARAAARDTETGRAVIKAPMPGLVVAVPVAAGRHVKQGDPLVILEAMKMETALTAPMEGVVAGVSVEPRQTVAAGATLVVVEREPASDV